MPKEMTQKNLRRIIQRYLLPMFPGARLLPGRRPAGPHADCASFDTPCEILVRPNNTWDHRLVIQRSQPFLHSDVMISFHFMNVVNEIIPVYGKPYFEQLLEEAVARALSRCVSFRDLVYQIIRQLDRWASQTYKGRGRNGDGSEWH